MRDPLLQELKGAVLVGVDGGATAIKALAVAVRRSGGELVLSPIGAAVEERWPRVEGFEPLPREEQELDRSGERLFTGSIGALEEEQGECVVRTCARVIREVVERCAARRALVGICMPGIKSFDARGVVLALHMPRMPDLCRRLELHLGDSNVELVGRLGPLASDGECAGHGEERGEHGLFRGMRDAYYLGAGTGLSEAWKLAGDVCASDAIAEWMPRAWQLETALGGTFESWLSADSIARRLTDAPFELRELDPLASGEPRGLDRLRGGEHRARRVSAERTIAAALAELIALRIETLARTGRGSPQLARVVLGQRFPHVIEGTSFPILEAARADLDHRLVRLEQTGILSGFGDVSRWRERFVREGIAVSTARIAPAIGAAWLALERLRMDGAR